MDSALKMQIVRAGHCLMILILCSILAGSAAIQILDWQLPCAFCWIQRAFMLTTASASALCLRFGVTPYYYSLSLLSSFLGGTVALRQIAMHACPGFPLFGIPVWGLSLYTWSFFVFAAALLSLALFLALYTTPTPSEPPRMNRWEKIACGFLVAIAFLMLSLAIAHCGFSDCAGRANVYQF
jgi:disulfide bond formation protein DsbB